MRPRDHAAAMLPMTKAQRREYVAGLGLDEEMVGLIRTHLMIALDRQALTRQHGERTNRNAPRA